jgi:hypothetical protein
MGFDASPVVSGGSGADRIGETPLRGRVAYASPADRGEADPFGIRDRVTISTEAYARTPPRFSTYNKAGSPSSIVPPSVLTGTAVYAESIRDQVTLVQTPAPIPVRRSEGTEPRQLRVWFSPNPAPQPG